MTEAMSSAHALRIEYADDLERELPEVRSGRFGDHRRAPVERHGTEEVRAGGARPDVHDEVRAGVGPVGLPQLPAMDAVIGIEQEGPAGQRPAFGSSKRCWDSISFQSACQVFQRCPPGTRTT